MINVFSDKRGSTPIPTAILVLIVSLIISVVMFFSYVQTQTIVVRNAMKTGLANLAITISEDTYTALRESSFDEYIERQEELPEIDWTEFETQFVLCDDAFPVQPDGDLYCVAQRVLEFLKNN